MSDPLAPIAESRALVQEMMAEITSALALGEYGPRGVPMSSGLLGELPPKDRPRFLSEYLDIVDDLFVVAMFAAFEQRVKDFAGDVLAASTLPSSSPAVAEWVGKSIRNARAVEIEEALAGQLAPSQVGDLRKLRKFRNWVAHGRRVPVPVAVARFAPGEAQQVLIETLAAIGAI